MIHIKLAQFAQKSNKSISDIARETDINRNTITSLYHNKTDGIKFSTLEKLCNFYDLAISDLIEYVDDKKEKTYTQYLYKQDALAVPFTAWPWMLAANNFNTQYFTKNFGDIDTYFRGSNGQCFFNKESMYELAKSVYTTYRFPKDIDALYDAYAKTTHSIIATYHNTSYKELMNMTIRETVTVLEALWNMYEEFWQMSYFIDSFDAGFDQETIHDIGEKYGFDKRELTILTTPAHLSYSNERLLILLNIIEKKKIHKDNINEMLSSKDIEAYIKTYDYYQGNYVNIRRIKKAELKKEILYYVENPEIMKKKIHDFQKFELTKKKQTTTVLKKHKLKTNPLYFFAKLTDWREDRKRVNMMGVYVLLNILKRIEDETGVSAKYLKFLSPEEIENVLSGLLTESELKRRYTTGMMISVCTDGVKILKGRQATSVRNELEEKLHRKNNTIILGHVACQGYAKGIARIILDEKDFSKLQKNEILVTSMTRPEFTPLIRKASAIVTDEGGITCHAAIIAKEINKPCIIATGNATEMISTGDLIEVRANHGTVRILQKKKPVRVE